MISSQLVGEGLPNDAFTVEMLKVVGSLTTTPPEFAVWAQSTATDGFRIADANLDGDSATSTADVDIFTAVGAGTATASQNKRWLDVVLPSLKEQSWYTEYPTLYLSLIHISEPTRPY